MKHLEHRFSENLLLTTTSRHETQSSSSLREYSDPIPVDLLIDIFSRVPAKSIARFRCVSKFWAFILGRFEFTELFLTKSFTRPHLFFTFEADGKLFFYSSPQPQNPYDNSSLVATQYHTSVPKYIPFDKPFYPAGVSPFYYPECFSRCYHTSLLQHFPCDISTPICGLVLLQGWRRRQVWVICNPAKGKVLILPKLRQVKASKDKIARMYFGYDPIGNQFKVLCMTIPSGDEFRPTTHWVLTLESSGKRLWRTIDRKFHFIEIFRTRGDVCVNGVLYFGGRVDVVPVILWFDVRSEKFGFINKDIDMSPEAGDFTGSLTLFNYKGKLGVHLRDRDQLVLWVLKDSGSHKWSKQTYVLPPLGKKIITNNKFVGITSTGEIVWSSYSCHNLSNLFYVFFYNLERKTFTRVNIQGFEGLKDLKILNTFVDYVENMKFM